MMSYAISKTNEQLLAKSEAMKKIYEHNRDYLSLTLTLPLGNPALKKVHTNQWLFTDLPKRFDLANWTIIADALDDNTVNRHEEYVKNKWYIEAVDISVEAGGKAEMKLTVNAFASSYSGYSDTAKSLSKAYTDAVKNVNSNTNNTTTSAAKTTTNAVQKNGKNTTLRGGEGKTIDNLVKKIVGNTTDQLQKAKKIHAWLKSNVRYGPYSCSRYSSAKACYEHRKHINCADTARLTRAMMSSAGLNAWVVHRSHSNGHFWTLIKINGKIYASDQTGDGSNWNTIWYGYGDRRTCNSRGGNWDSKNGKNPSC